MRVWDNRGDDDGSVHAMGNGQMVVYGRGPDVVFMYGPPYSSPSILTLTTESESYIKDEANRELATAIWDHKSSVDGKPAVEFTEFTAAGLPAYIRNFKCAQSGTRWIIRPNAVGGFIQSASVKGAWQQAIPPGQKIFNYPSNLWYYHWIIPTGSCRAELSSDGLLIIHLEPGEGSLAIVGGSDYPAGMSAVEQIVKAGPDQLLENSRKDWLSFTKRRLKTKLELAKMPSEVSEILDSTAVLIKSQQSDTGGVMAGPVFPLAYIRDQYGVARGMLALGMHEEAKLNLEFRFAKFQRFGSLLTAEAMGTDCARHRHENDEVEGPAYTILQVRDYINRIRQDRSPRTLWSPTADNAFGKKLWPMLKWCWQVQQKHMVNGLLPFNGDETYVAGGFYPRSGLTQGSADTTLVYFEAGKWLSEWALHEKLWTQDQILEAKAQMATAGATYRQYFLDGSRIWANAPEYESMAKLPRFRHGVCEGTCGWFGWTERSKNGRYVCPKCLAEKDLPAQHPEKMEVNSVSLLPAYIGSTVLSNKEIHTTLDHVLKQSNESRHIPSVPGTEGCVGYDPGLVLMNMTRTGHPRTQEAYLRLLRLLDRTQAWNEYYDGKDGVRTGCCRCRPWESGVNAAAIVEYVEPRP